MKRYFLFIGILFAVLVGIVFFVKWRTVPQNSNNKVVNLKQYSNKAYGLSFSYPATYILGEMDIPENEVGKHYLITLMRKEDLPLPANGEGPPSITVDIYQNNFGKQNIEEWVRNSSTSNFKFGEGALASTTIDGLPAFSYRWSGLYEGTTIVLARPSWIYEFTVTYLEMGAPIIQDFVAIRDSVRTSKP